MSDYYVYLLRDPRIEDFIESIFYVGKGIGTRAIAHAKNALNAASLAAMDDETFAANSAKEDRLRELDALGLSANIDVLLERGTSGISQEQAFTAEAALIELLQHKAGGLANKVKGHRLRLVPDGTYDMGRNAATVELPAGMQSVLVSVTGLWTETDYNGTYVPASEDQVWTDASQLWSRFGQAMQARIERQARTDNPVRLIALAEDPRKLRKNIIVGVFPIESVIPSPDGELKGGRHKCGPECTLDDKCTNRTRTSVGWIITRAAQRQIDDSWMLGGVLHYQGQAVRRREDRSYLPPMVS